MILLHFTEEQASSFRLKAKAHPELDGMKGNWFYPAPSSEDELKHLGWEGRLVRKIEEVGPETWPTRKFRKVFEEAKQEGNQVYLVEGPRGGYRGVVTLSDTDTFLKLHPSLRLKPIFK